MGFLDAFRKKESDPEIRRLEDMARATRNAPEPYEELALAYMDKIRTPPNWDEAYAKKAVNAFQKASETAEKHSPAQVGSIQVSLVRSMYQAAKSYQMYSETHDDVQCLETAIWLLEKTEAEREYTPDYKKQVEDLLLDCWLQSAANHFGRLHDDENEGVERLNLYVKAAERAMAFMDKDSRAELDAEVAGVQLAIGHRYAVRVTQSPVLNQPGGNLPNMNDRESKKNAQLAIQLFKEGRARLKPYPDSGDYEDTMAETDKLIASTYDMLHTLTWAHSKMEKAIKILQKAVKEVPGDAGLWYALGRAYEHLVEETVGEMTKSYNRGVSASNALGLGKGLSGSIANALGSGIARGSINLKVRSIEKKAAECFAKAHQLAPDDF